MINNDKIHIVSSVADEEFVTEEFDMIQLLCKISQGCFPEPRIIFYNKQGRRMQNNENIQIGGFQFFEIVVNNSFKVSKRRIVAIEYSKLRFIILYNLIFCFSNV